MVMGQSLFMGGRHMGGGRGWKGNEMTTPYYVEGHKKTKAFQGEGNKITFHLIYVQISTIPEALFSICFKGEYPRTPA